MSNDLSYVVLTLSSKDDPRKLFGILESNDYYDFVHIPKLHTHYAVRAYIDQQIDKIQRGQTVYDSPTSVTGNSNRVSSQFGTPVQRPTTQVTAPQLNPPTSSNQTVKVEVDEVSSSNVTSMVDYRMKPSSFQFKCVKSEPTTFRSPTCSIQRNYLRNNQQEDDSITYFVESDEELVIENQPSPTPRYSGGIKRSSSEDYDVLSKKPKRGVYQHGTDKKFDNKSTDPSRAIDELCKVCCKSINTIGRWSSFQLLLRHAKTHCEEKQFSCSVEGCGFSSCDSGNVNRHMREQHDEKRRPNNIVTNSLKRAWRDSYSVCFPSLTDDLSNPQFIEHPEHC